MPLLLTLAMALALPPEPPPADSKTDGDHIVLAGAATACVAGAAGCAMPCIAVVPFLFPVFAAGVCVAPAVVAGLGVESAGGDVQLSLVAGALAGVGAVVGGAAGVALGVLSLLSPSWLGAFGDVGLALAYPYASGGFLAFGGLGAGVGSLVGFAGAQLVGGLLGGTAGTAGTFDDEAPTTPAPSTRERRRRPSPLEPPPSLAAQAP
jgi:hypothetical protein